jgi:hypothetical protein
VVDGAHALLCFLLDPVRTLMTHLFLPPESGLGMHISRQFISFDFSNYFAV